MANTGDAAQVALDVLLDNDEDDELRFWAMTVLSIEPGTAMMTVFPDEEESYRLSRSRSIEGSFTWSGSRAVHGFRAVSYSGVAGSGSSY